MKRVLNVMRRLGSLTTTLAALALVAYRLAGRDKSRTRSRVAPLTNGPALCRALFSEGRHEHRNQDSSERTRETR